jgi:hypothetical protein
MAVEEIQNQTNRSQPFTTPTSTTDALSRSRAMMLDRFLGGF